MNNLEFTHYFIECHNFKEKDIKIMNAFISGAKMGEFVGFENCCNITFDEEDTIHKYPIVKKLDVYNRNKVNGLIYDIKPNSHNPGVWTKALIYQTVTPSNNGFYGFIIYNEETGKQLHIYDLNYTINNVLLRLFNTINHAKKYYIDNKYGWYRW